MSTKQIVLQLNLKTNKNQENKKMRKSELEFEKYVPKNACLLWSGSTH